MILIIEKQPRYYPQIVEHKWQEKWLKAKVFEPQPGGGKKFFITVPYPYSTGPLHVGHGRTYTTTDLFARFKRMQGYNVLWPMGFHITGTPVLAISAQLKRKDKEKIELYKDYVSLYVKNKKKVDEIVKSFVEPANVAKFFSDVIGQDFKSIGFSIDWSRQFTTADPDYQKFVTWQFLKFKELGLLVKGSYPVLFCETCDNAVGEDDIKDGDRIKAEVVTFAALKFPFEDGFLVPSTFRPETIFGATNLWVNPKSTYVKAKIDGEVWYISERAAHKLSKQEHKVEVIEKFQGSKIVGKKCKNILQEKGLPEEFPILAADFVDVNEATGVVYSVPAHAPYDYIALKDAKMLDKIKMISIAKVPGYKDFPAKEICERFGIKNQKEREKLDKATEELYKTEYYKGVLKENCGKFSGKKIAHVKDEVGKWLKDIKKAADVFEVKALEKPAYCRCGGEVIVSVLKDQWFIHYGDKKWKQKANDALKKMTIYPEQYRKFFEDTFAWLDKKPCVRRRGLGTPFPFETGKGWIIESLSDSTIYMAFYIIKKKINEFNLKVEQLTPEFWDCVLLGKGKCTSVPQKQLDEIRKDFMYWYPNDQRHTSIPHISNHLSFFIFAHAAIFPQQHWPKAITLNELLIREGRKMSKSFGNVMPLAEIPKKYSADLFRLYVSQAADLETTLDWKETEVESTRKKLMSFYRLVLAMQNLGGGKTNLDAWMLSRLNRSIKACTEQAENYHIRNYVQTALYTLMNDINHYLQRTKTPDKEVLQKISDTWIRLMAPVVPHMCEELWEKTHHDGFVSTAKWPVADTTAISDSAEQEENFLVSLEKDITEVIKLAGVTAKKITLFIAPEWKHNLYEKAKKKDMKELMKEPRAKENAKYVQYLVKRKHELGKILSEEKEFKTVSNFVEFLEKEFNAKIVVEKAAGSEHPKAKNAVPGKPAIFAE